MDRSKHKHVAERVARDKVAVVQLIKYHQGLSAMPEELGTYRNLVEKRPTVRGETYHRGSEGDTENRFIIVGLFFNLVRFMVQVG